MTDAQKLETLQTLLSDGGIVPDVNTLQTYLNIAAEEILQWQWHLLGGVPDSITEVPSRYSGTQIYAVLAGYTHAGAEGQNVHNENNVSRHFIYSDMLDYIHNHVLPFARVGAVE